MVQTSARLLALLSLLQIRREWTGQELADRLEKADGDGNRLRVVEQQRRQLALGAEPVKDERATKRNTEPCAVVYSGYRWYLVAFDLDRDDWRTFRIDRIRGRVRQGRRGRRRTVPGGDPAAYVKQQLRTGDGGERPAAPGRIRLGVSAAHAGPRIPKRYASVEPDGEDACIVSTRGTWSREFLVWMALLDEPMEVLGPPELADAARALVARLGATA